MIQLATPGIVALDTAVFIYYIERRLEYAAAVVPIFQAYGRGEIEIVTSSITLLEVLVKPYRAADPKLALDYEDILTRSDGLRMIDVDRGQLMFASRLRAHHGLKTPDALQIAAALTAGCSAFITNDKRLPDIPGLSIIQLRDLQ